MTPAIRDSGCTASPNTEQLRRHGWHISSMIGPYCTAWKDGEEVLLIWKDGAWQRVGAQTRDTSPNDAA